MSSASSSSPPSQPTKARLWAKLRARPRTPSFRRPLVPFHYPVGDGPETAVEFGVDAAKFREVVAADLPAGQTAVMAATQRPIAELAFTEPCGPPAWKTRPSWAIVATHDKAAGADLVRSHAERAEATITEVEGSHVIMVSQPEAVADVILTAADAVDRQAVATGG